VRKAFAGSKPPRVSRVAVRDDVLTAGSTVKEVARMFRAGVRDIEIWAIARAG
jgi:predicted amidophosphoribosyltransferase